MNRIFIAALLVLTACDRSAPEPPPPAPVEKPADLCAQSCQKRQSCHPLTYNPACADRCRATSGGPCGAEQEAVMACQVKLECDAYRHGCESEQAAWARCARDKMLDPSTRDNLTAFEAKVEELRKPVIASTAKDLTDIKAIELELAARATWDEQVRRSSLTIPASSPRDAKILRRLAARVVRDVSRDNVERLTTLLAKYEWFGTDKFSPEAGENAWNLIQHADHDLAFQSRVLGVLQRYGREERAKLAHVAFLEDRVAIARGKKQRYGTQGYCTPEGVWKWREVDDPLKVDLLRERAGLDKLAKYAADAARTCPKR